MNKKFEDILINNKKFIETINNIYTDIIIKENSLLGHMKQVLNPKDLLSILKEELKSKKYKNFISEIIYVPILDVDEKISIIDKNDKNWTFCVIENNLKLTEICNLYGSDEDLKNNREIVITHQKYISAISQSFIKKIFLLDISDKDITKEDCDLLMITKDIDLNFLINQNVNSMVFPKSNNLGIEDMYNKKSILKKIFN